MNTDIIDCGREFAPEILDIYNDAIVNTTALYDYKPRPPESMVAWFDAKEEGNYPVIGIVDENGALAAFGSYGSFRPRPAYHYSAELSVYVRKDRRGKGCGKILLAELIRRATAQDYHCLVAVIDSENAVSIRLHGSFGFSECGRMKEVGYKFGRWLDVVFMQLLLPTPANPGEI